MPPKAESNFTPYMDSEPLPPLEELPAIELPPDVSGGEGRSLLEPMTLTLHIKRPKYWRCRSRKRFIKLLMGMGWPRNTAENLAGFLRILEIPYSDAWKSTLWTGAVDLRCKAKED